jgi:hypothetical protein
MNMSQITKQYIQQLENMSQITKQYIQQLENMSQITKHYMWCLSVLSSALQCGNSIRFVESIP